MDKMQASPTFQPSLMREQICRWWCEGLKIDRVEGAYAIRLPAVWPNGDALMCYLEDQPDGSVSFSDWKALNDYLFVQGVHNSNLLDAYAIALGFERTPHGEFRIENIRPENIANIVHAFSNLSAVAMGEMSQIKFEAAPLIIPTTWHGILAKDIIRPGIQILQSTKHLRVDKPGLIRSATVAIQGTLPLVVSPVVNGNTGGYQKLTQLIHDAEDSIRGIVPLIRARDESHFLEERDRFFDAATRSSQRFELDAVGLFHGDDAYSPETKQYPAVARMTAGAHVFARVLDKVLRVA